MNLKKPTYYERLVIWLIKKSKVSSRIMENALGEAYDLGFNAGILEGSKLNGGKKYANKVKKALRKAYSVKA
ncbi:MAG: hypothetical protein Unbinned5336contig1001_7 [Prokaryotic dsDNA virus sp.]|nr:MAG: hypothetical protein Unbinned5336contig1001_7 [Prokaryotic dsDNA virus sp.]|tara:strand:+ start:677 stop:892 length:216 start_codon:yes stop_codon:yes gene_type:complete